MEFDVHAISKLRVFSSVFGVRIIEKDVSSIECILKNIDEDEVTIDEKDGILSIMSNKDGRFFSHAVDGKRTVKILVPKGKHFQAIKLNVGLGVLKVKNISTAKLKVNGGVGYSLFENVTVSELVKIESGVGKLEVLNSSFNNLRASGGVGSFSFQGKITGESAVACGVGKIILDIDAKTEDYNIIGNSSKMFSGIVINGEKITSKYRKNHDAAHTLKLSSGIGRLEVMFKD